MTDAKTNEAFAVALLARELAKALPKDRALAIADRRGLCMCGCGQTTTVSPYTRALVGIKKGEPRKYVRGHAKRTPGRSGSYRHVGVGGGKIELVHRIVAAAALGRALESHEVVHHINGDKSDNRRSNLLICDEAYHQLLHARERALDACGNPSWRACTICGEYDAPVNMKMHSKKQKRTGTLTPQFRHPACMNAAARARRARKKAAA